MPFVGATAACFPGVLQAAITPAHARKTVLRATTTLRSPTRHTHSVTTGLKKATHFPLRSQEKVDHSVSINHAAHAHGLCGASLMDSDAVFPFSGVIARVSRDMRLPTRKRALAFLCIVLGAAAVVALSPPAAWIMGLVLLTALAWLAFIDIDRMTLPNVATYPLIALGILLPNPVAPDLVDRIAGAVSGYALLAVVAVIYRKTRGRDGIGLGDAKLFAAGGAWLGWSALPGVLLFASSLAIVCVLFLRVRGAAMTSASVVPFGPFLALGVMGIWLSSFSFAANA